MVHGIWRQKDNPRVLGGSHKCRIIDVRWFWYCSYCSSSQLLKINERGHHCFCLHPHLFFNKPQHCQNILLTLSILYSKSSFLFYCIIIHPFCIHSLCFLHVGCLSFSPFHFLYCLFPLNHPSTLLVPHTINYIPNCYSEYTWDEMKMWLICLLHRKNVKQCKWGTVTAKLRSYSKRWSL